MTDRCECYDPVLPVRRDGLSSARGVWSRIVDVIVAMFSCVHAWQERAMTRRHLASLNDHMLKDIGISRADVEYEIRKPFWQE